MEPRFNLGVLFVHGIGSQPWGDSLVRWGDVLLQTITRSTVGQVTATVDEAGAHEMGADRIAEAHVRLTYGARTERWLLSEGWWADSFPAPTYSELVSWSLRALPWAIALNIARSYWNAAPSTRGQKLTTTTVAAGKLFLLLPLVPVLLFVLACVLLIGAIPPLRGWVLGLQSTLTATMGDSLAFVESPVRAALIRTRLQTRLAELVRRCDHTVVIAHSQGAAAMLDALGGIAGVKDTGRRETRSVPNALVTFGAAVNQVVSQRVISSGSAKDDRIVTAIAAVLIFYAFAGWILWAIWAQPTASIPYLTAFGLILLTGATCTILLLAFRWLGSWVVRRRPSLERYHTTTLAWAMVTTGITSVFLLVHFFDELPIGVVGGVLWVAVMLIGAFAALLSRDLEQLVQAPVQTPSGLDSWIDLPASMDPVSNGPTKTNDSNMPRHVPLWNRASMFTDHTSYWENVDGFVVRVVRVCAATAQSAWATELRHDMSQIDARSRWRVSVLPWVRWSCLVLWSCIAAILYTSGREALIPLPPGLPTWLPASAARPLLFVALMSLGVWMTFTMVFAIWSWWTRGEQLAALAGDRPKGNGFGALTALAGVLWVLVLVALACVRPPPAGFWRDVDILIGFSGAVLGFAWVSALVLLKLHPPPALDPHQKPTEVPVRT